MITSIPNTRFSNLTIFNDTIKQKLAYFGKCFLGLTFLVLLLERSPWYCVTGTKCPTIGVNDFAIKWLLVFAKTVLYIWYRFCREFLLFILCPSTSSSRKLPLPFDYCPIKLSKLSGWRGFKSWHEKKKKRQWWRSPQLQGGVL